jgi:hypothetical protein
MSTYLPVTLSAPQIFTRMGQCYTFNSGAQGTELLTTPKGGAGNGLEVMLDVQQEEYLPVWRDVGKGYMYEAGSLPMGRDAGMGCTMGLEGHRRDTKG